MTKQAGFKRRVRARMAKTGESYATARSRLLAEHPGTTPGDSPLDWMPEALHVSNGDATDVPGTGHPGTTPGDSPLGWMPGALHVSNGDATDVPGPG